MESLIDPDQINLTFRLKYFLISHINHCFITIFSIRLFFQLQTTMAFN